MRLLYRPLRAVLLRTPLGFQRRLLRDLLGRQAQQPDKAAALQALFAVETDLDRFLNRAAIAYEGSGLHPKHRLMRYADFFARRVEPGQRVLDIGCGSGFVAHAMARQAGAAVTGIDLNADSIDLARRLWQHPRLTFVVGDALHDLPDTRFEVVVLSNVLEHIEQRVAFLQQVQAQVQPDRFLLRVPLFERDWRGPLKEELGLFPYSDPTHCTEYTPPAFVEELQQAGLAVAHLQTQWGEIWAEARPQSSQNDNE